MIAWIQTAARLPYVAAILTDREAALQYLLALPVSTRERSTVVVRDDLALPCYLAEDASGFRTLSASEAQAYLAILGNGAPDVEGVYGILYRLDGPFLPQVPGRDEMGRLPHMHLEADDLVLAVRAGVAALWGDRSELDAPGV